MRLAVAKEKLPYNIKVFMNRLGYHELPNRHSHQISYSRRLGAWHYPRFHVYIDMKKDHYVFNIHYDEKQPSYGVGHAHSGRYEGPLVEEEIRRIKQVLR